LRAVVTGATGAVGSALVGELLSSSTWSRVTTVGRRAVSALPPEFKKVDIAAETKSGRLVQHVVKMEALEKQTAAFADHDASFCCWGSTRGEAGGAEAFRKIEFGTLKTFTDLAKAAKIPHHSLVSSKGADATSWFTYMAVKGDCEEYIRKAAFTNAAIFRPGFLGRGDKQRAVEKVAIFFSPLIPSLRPVSVNCVARAMRLHAERALDPSTAAAPATTTAATSTASSKSSTATTATSTATAATTDSKAADTKTSRSTCSLSSSTPPKTIDPKAPFTIYEHADILRLGCPS